MSADSALREPLARSLAWSDAHVSLDEAVRGLPARLRGARPAGLPHSPWELVEHIRLAQRDILDFCTGEAYQELAWPSDYWPATPEPPSAEAWEQSLARIRSDREALQRLASDSTLDLMSVAKHGTDQPLLRQLLLVVDHTAYHVGQLVLVRKLLGSWPAV